MVREEWGASRLGDSSAREAAGGVSVSGQGGQADALRAALQGDRPARVLRAVPDGGAGGRLPVLECGQLRRRDPPVAGGGHSLAGRAESAAPRLPRPAGILLRGVAYVRRPGWQLGTPNTGQLR